MTTSHDEHTCEELVEEITDYLEGTMAPPARERFESHLEGCPFCTVYLDQMRTTISRMGELREETLSPETREGLLDAFRGWRDEGRA
jgi:anti-sigma factor RsiW